MLEGRNTRPGPTMFCGSCLRNRAQRQRFPSAANACFRDVCAGLLARQGGATARTRHAAASSSTPWPWCRSIRSPFSTTSPGNRSSQSSNGAWNIRVRPNAEEQKAKDGRVFFFCYTHTLCVLSRGYRRLSCVSGFVHEPTARVDGGMDRRAILGQPRRGAHSLQQCSLPAWSPRRG